MDEPNKVDPVIPSDTPVETPDYKDIHDNSMRDIATETPAPAPEEPVPTPEPEPVTAPTPEPQPQPIDEEAVKRIADEAAQAALEKQREAAKPETPEEDEYATWEKSLWEKEKRQPTYREALEFVSEQAERRLEEKQAAAKKQAEEATEAEKQRQTQEQQKLDNLIDDELNDLYNAGKLTRIKDPTNPSDQGVIERKALFTRWSEVNTQRRAKGLPDIISATRIIEFHGYERPQAQPAGADAPIAGNRGTGEPPSAKEEYSNADLKKPWSFFRRN